LNATAARPSTAILLSLFALALGVRLVLVFTPLGDLAPPPYQRALNFADAARNVLAGQEAVVDREWLRRAIDDWHASGHRLPPLPLTISRSDHPDLIPFYDELGYLALTLAFARVTGEVYWLSPILVQCLLSSAIAVILCMSIAEGFGNQRVALLFGLTYALHPLEVVLSIGPDLPVWGIYAGAVSLSLVAFPWTAPSLAQATWRFAAGLFLGLCIVQRGPNLAAVAASLVALMALRRYRDAAWTSAGALLALLLFSSVPLGTPSVGRNAMHHTLLAGLSEFGDIEGLAWEDAKLHRYLQERYGVDPFTPEFDASAKRELEKQVRERPWLPLKVVAQRLAEFTFAWRPGRTAPLLLVTFTAFKLAVAFGTCWACAWCRNNGRRPLLFWSLAVASAPLLAHALIVPLLEVYIAATLVLLTPLAIAGAIGLGRRTGIRLLPVAGLFVMASGPLAATSGTSVVIDATGKSFREVQDEFYAVIEPIITSNHITLFNELPFRVKLTGTATCSFDDATDYGDLRACLGVFASGPYSKNRRPTPTAKSFNPVPRGGFVIDLDGFNLRFDADGSGIQTKPVIGVMIGSGYFAGHRKACDKQTSAPCDVFQWGDIPGIRLVGNLLIHATDVHHGTWNRRKLPTFYFSDPVNSSPTTFVGLWIDSNPQTDMRALQYTYQGAGGDFDDLAFACHNSFDSTLGGLWISSGNGPLFGPGCHNFVVATGDINSSDLDRFGMALSSPRGPIGPVDDACAPGSCAERSVGGTGPVFLNQITVEGFQTENLVSFLSTSADMNLWVEGEPADGHGLTLGAGACTSDGSVCALDGDCPHGSCVSGFPNAQQIATLRGFFHGPLALGPGARDPFASPGEKSAGIRIEGYWSGPGPTVTIHPEANVPVDLSALRSGDPLPIPPSFKGIFTPQLPLSYHPHDCRSLTKGQWQQQCCERDTWSCYVCEPDGGGASPALCDSTVDWVRINQTESAIAATASRELSTSDAAGAVITNTGANRPIVLTLPEASPGLCLKVVLTQPFDVDVKPRSSQQILRRTHRSGAGLSSDTSVGSVLELCAVGDDAWAIIREVGVWSEVD
jgi:hypothetical protein